MDATSSRRRSADLGRALGRVLTQTDSADWPDGKNRTADVMEVIRLLDRGTEAAELAGETLLGGVQRSLWRRALREGPAQALPVTLAGLGTPKATTTIMPSRCRPMRDTLPHGRRFLNFVNARFEPVLSAAGQPDSPNCRLSIPRSEASQACARWTLWSKAKRPRPPGSATPRRSRLLTCATGCAAKGLEWLPKRRRTLAPTGSAWLPRFAPRHQRMDDAQTTS